MSDLRERKHHAELVPADFDEHPVWQCWYAEDGSLVVGPTDKLEVTYDHADDSPATDIVFARFTLADGESLPGFCMPHEYLAAEYYQPTIMTERGHVYFYRNDGFTDRDRKGSLAVLGRLAGDVFPIRFEMIVRFDGEIVRGLITDFDQCCGEGI